VCTALLGRETLIQRLSGWGRFPVESCRVFRPERHEELCALLSSSAAPTYIARGLGRSYGDAALNRDSGVVSQLRLNHFLSFDARSGVVECEAGVSLAELIDVFLPRGLFLPVTPGTKFVTLGGAIAADVHGKNHHCDGTIGNFVLDLKLLTPAGEILTCSPAENADVFRATLGGMGLTGMILSARLRPVESAYVVADYHRAASLDDALARFAESDERYQYSVAWVDCLAAGRAMGRGVLMRGNHAPAEAVRRETKQPLALPQKPRLRVPLDVPSFVLNPLTIGAFNAVYYAVHGDAADRLVDLDSFFYPLDAIHDWNRMYGRRGFVQYQLALPLDGGREGLVEILERLAKTHRPSFLAVLKRFGPQNDGMLSFPFAGYTLAMDIPAANGLVAFLHELDRIVLRRGGRVYLAKDAVLEPETFAEMYPRLGEFRAVRERLDPRGVLSSSLGRRLRIVSR
jgi:FAD/FMN-containing dehydrogenase